MRIKNTDNRYGLVAIFLHWSMAILLIGLLGYGLYMVGLPISLQKLKLFGWHKELGMLALFLVALRIVWRLSNKRPSLGAIPKWQKFSARTAHLLFYGFMVLIPLSGWLITSASGVQTSFFGWFLVPHLIAPSKTLFPIFVDIHKWLSYGLIGILFLHSSAALVHHCYYKDNVLRRMFS